MAASLPASFIRIIDSPPVSHVPVPPPSPPPLYGSAPSGSSGTTPASAAPGLARSPFRFRVVIPNEDLWDDMSRTSSGRRI
eukprot:12263751-Heterocapsa_arctica.AAC.1